MGECICSSCRNLKSIFNEEGVPEEFECEFGFPSEKCDECSVEECQETCSHYICDEEDDELVVVKCKKCGKELKKSYKDDSDGDVLCIDCYLNS